MGNPNIRLLIKETLNESFILDKKQLVNKLLEKRLLEFKRDVERAFFDKDKRFLKAYLALALAEFKNDFESGLDRHWRQ